MNTCAACGQENPAIARFCLACGEPFADSMATAHEERRVVSVIFVDLVGFTARAERLDPEDVRAILTPYHDCVRREIESFGGVVEKFIGDAVMGVFGAPIAYGDDTERAVRAALVVRDSVAAMNAADPRLDLQIRVAVNTGEALTSLNARPALGESMVVGDVVNTASRLQQAAPVNGVAVGEEPYLATRESIVYEPGPAVVAKGKSAPLSVWLALRAATVTLRATMKPLLPDAQAIDVADPLGLMLGLDPDSAVADRETLFFSVRCFIEAVARDRPTAFIFEDLHWADRNLLDLVEQL